MDVPRLLLLLRGFVAHGLAVLLAARRDLLRVGWPSVLLAVLRLCPTVGSWCPAM